MAGIDAAAAPPAGFQRNPGWRLSVNIELLFREAGPNPADRVMMAAEQGIEGVEIWGSADKDVVALAGALDKTGTTMVTMVAEPRSQLAIDSSHEEFLAGVRESVRRAQTLQCQNLVVTAGIGLPYQNRVTQQRTVADALKAAADIVGGAGMTLLLENLNTRVDHPGTLLDHTSDCLDILREVATPSLCLLYDMYHSLTMGESVAVALRGDISRVRHVQLADLPGRGEPGTGTVDWGQQLTALRDLGYSGWLGVECYPSTGSVDALRFIRRLLADGLDTPSATG